MFHQHLLLFLVVSFSNLSQGIVSADEPTYQQVNKILTKYCTGCHSEDEPSGDFALHSFDAILKGGENGNAITPGSSASSRLILLMQQKLEPAMPPEGESQPSEDEIQMVVDWIDSGAKGPSGESTLPTRLDAPEIDSKVSYQPVTAMALSKDQQHLAVAGFQQVQIFDADGDLQSKPKFTFTELPGKVTSLAFMNNGKQLLVGSGVAGLYGEAILLEIQKSKIIRRFRGHSDMIYAVAVSPDEKQIATAGYDGKAMLWNPRSNKPVREFSGHNDSIFGCSFNLTGELLITASADSTVKIWRTADGTRLDTRGEALKETYSVALSGDGSSFFAAGEDNRIRKWRLESRDANQTNPLLVARFAHEAAIQILRFHPNGKSLVSVATNGVIKIWDSETMNEVFRFPDQTSVVQSLAIGKKQIFIGRMDGSVERIPWPTKILASQLIKTAEQMVSSLPKTDLPETLPTANTPKVKPTVSMSKGNEELEPNNETGNAQAIRAPFELSGTINDADQPDVDHFRFLAKKGQRLIVETRAAVEKSPLDTRIAILDSDGQPVPRVLLKAVRDSYFTFRGKNSTQTGDFRIHNWEEMKLGQMLYCNGEVVKLYHYPRGPDSGYNVFPNFGKRHGFFDTTSIAHALHEPCYVVEAHEPGTELAATGLPHFLLNYENDDDGERELGTDSRLTFTAPADGEYIVQVRDSRGFQGNDYKYTLRVRPEDPTFKIKAIKDKNPTLIRGAYKKLIVEVDRIDNFMGPIDIVIDDLPDGIIANGPVTIERNNLRAFMTIFISDDAPTPPEDAMSASVTATATVNGKLVRSSTSLGKLKFNADPKLTLELRHASDVLPHFDQNRLPVFEIHPGETITASVKANRRGHSARINFGKEEATLNLPMGIYVSNTGLNGVLIPPDKTERTFFIEAEKWVKPSQRLIFLEAEEAGKPSSNPAVLRVLPLTEKATKASRLP